MTGSSSSSALISRRDYYTDAWWMIAVAVTPDAPYSLEQLHEALRYPVFPLYLGRKSHPLALPLMPLLLEGHAAEVLRQAYRQYQERFNLLRLSLRQLQVQYHKSQSAGQHQKCFRSQN